MMSFKWIWSLWNCFRSDLVPRPPRGSSVILVNLKCCPFPQTSPDLVLATAERPFDSLQSEPSMSEQAKDLDYMTSLF